MDKSVKFEVKTRPSFLKMILPYPGACGLSTITTQDTMTYDSK